MPETAIHLSTVGVSLLSALAWATHNQDFDMAHTILDMLELLATILP